MRSNCKGCQASVNLSETRIEEMLAELKEQKGTEVVSEKVYQKRLAECRKCKYFVHNTTCRQNGSIIVIKAKLSSAACVNPGGARWEQQ